MLCTQLRQRRRSSHGKLVWASRKNIVVTGVPDRGRRYLSDFYTTLIDIQWRWNLLFFVVGFVLTWLLFATYYFLLCFLHGDLEPDHRVDNSTWIPCVENVNSFTEAYLFSIETMSTIGYGWRYQTEECPGVYLAVMLQSVIGAGLQFALASLVVSKTRRANRFSQTILFSNTAVIYQEDGQLKLAVRIGDMRKGDVIGAHATGMLIKKTTGKAGHKVPVRMFTVPFEAEGGREKLFLCWPCLLIHCVDENSPLWALSREDLMHDTYELIVILDGVAATSSKPFQARKSYHSWEILWGHRFKPLTINDDDINANGYVVNYNHFHDTHPVSVPFCSAQTLERNRLLSQLSEEDEEGSIEDLEVESESGRSSVLSTERNVKTSDAATASSLSDSEDKDELLCQDVAVQTEREDAGEDASNAKRRSSVSIRISPADSISTSSTSMATTKEGDERLIRCAYVPPKERVRKMSRVEFQPLSIKGTPSHRRVSLGGGITRQKRLSLGEGERTHKRLSLGEGGITHKRLSLGEGERTHKRLSLGEGETTHKRLSLGEGERTHKRLSLGEGERSGKRLSLGEGEKPQKRLSLGDAVNMYRHRRSVTDTYLGTELPEEDSDDSEASAAILSIVSQQSRGSVPDGRPDVRDVFKLRRKSTTVELMFGREGLDNDSFTP